MPGAAPVGSTTRGTTNPNRLRRVDRWLADVQGWRLRRSPTAPVVVDLGYGASPVTAVELHERLQRVRADVEVVGLEIDQGRVRAAAPWARPGLRFAHGGFEVPLPGGQRATIVRAFNVLRQYPEVEVPGAWATVIDRLEPQGILVDGTCDEIGRLSSWVCVTADGPQSLTLSWRLRGLDRPSDIAERLPKALIHRNVSGEPVHEVLQRLDDGWRRSAAYASFGARQRFVTMASTLREEGLGVLGGRSRWRLGELTIRWADVAPR